MIAARIGLGHEESRPDMERRTVTLPIALLLVAIFAGMVVGRLQPPPGRGSIPWLTPGFVVALASALVAQSLFPLLLPRFERDGAAIFGGEYYRLFTALWFQDVG